MTQHIKKNARLLAVLGALAALSMAGTAIAGSLDIVQGSTCNAGNNNCRESIGDNGGTFYPNAPTPGATEGPGFPTIQGGWPDSPNFGVDNGPPPGQGNRGISGYDGSYLNLNHDSELLFQFMGKGNSGDHNQFQLFLGGTWVVVWDNQDLGPNGPNGTCGASGNPPVIDCPFPGSTFRDSFTVGLIPFRYVNLTTGQLVGNDLVSNSHDSTVNPNFFLGVDPYLATGQYQTNGDTVYAGFSDRPQPGDHDYQDLVVRISGVPEIDATTGTGALTLLAGALAVASDRRKRRQPTET